MPRDRCAKVALACHRYIRLLPHAKESVVKTVRGKRDTPRVGREGEKEATTITILVYIRTEVKQNDNIRDGRR